MIHLRPAEDFGLDVAQDDHVVREEVILRRRERRQSRAVLVAVLGVGRLEDDVQVDRLFAVEERLEVTKLVARLAVHIENPEPLLADIDRLLDPVVVVLLFPILAVHLDDVRDLPGLARPMADLDAGRLAVGRGAQAWIVSSSLVALGSAVVGHFLLQADRSALAWRTPSNESIWAGIGRGRRRKPRHRRAARKVPGREGLRGRPGRSGRTGRPCGWRTRRPWRSFRPSVV